MQTQKKQNITYQTFKHYYVFGDILVVWTTTNKAMEQALHRGGKSTLYGQFQVLG